MKTIHMGLAPLLGAILLAAAPAMAQQDPGTLGPYAVTKTSYGSNGTSISLGEIPTVEVLAEVHRPTNLTAGPFPLVILLHGRHATCYELSSGVEALAWPCNPSTQASIPSYRGYDYVAQVLASHGMIVASISANGINAVDNGTSSYGMYERGALIQHHLDKWRAFNTASTAPFGSTFVGKVDLTRVGTMGHSRGGEGVIWNYEQNVAAGSPYGIRAVLPVAPVDFFGHFINDVALGVVLPYCDGDVYELPGVAFLDDARYASPGDKTPKYTFLAHGANHNYFNRFWTPDQYPFGSGDDWQWRDSSDPHCGPTVVGNGRLTSAAQRGVGTAYLSAFFRRHLQDAVQFDPLLKGDVPPPPSAQSAKIYEAYFPADFDRKDLNRLTTDWNLTSNTLLEPVSAVGLSLYSQCGDWTLTSCGAGGREPHVGSLLAAEIGWSNTNALYGNQLPIGQRDISNFATLQFRVALKYTDAGNPEGLPRTFRIALSNDSTTSPTVPVEWHTDVLYYPPGTPWNRAAVMNTARIPLSAFTGIDLTNVSQVLFSFEQDPTGAILLSDLAFSDEGMTTSEKWLVASVF